MTTGRPFLLFQDNNAEEAMRLYVSPFDDGKIVEVIHYASGTPGREGWVMKGTFFVAGQTLLCTDSIANTPSRSRPRYRCSSNASRTRSSDKLVAALSAGGAQLMPPDNYGFSRRFAWVSDRFGVSWQLNLG